MAQTQADTISAPRAAAQIGRSDLACGSSASSAVRPRLGVCAFGAGAPAAGLVSTGLGVWGGAGWGRPVPGASTSQPPVAPVLPSSQAPRGGQAPRRPGPSTARGRARPRPPVGAAPPHPPGSPADPREGWRSDGPTGGPVRRRLVDPSRSSPPGDRGPGGGGGARGRPKARVKGSRGAPSKTARQRHRSRGTVPTQTGHPPASEGVTGTRTRTRNHGPRAPQAHKPPQAHPHPHPRMRTAPEPELRGRTGKR